MEDWILIGRRNIMESTPPPPPAPEAVNQQGVLLYTSRLRLVSPIPTSKWFAGIPHNLCSPYVLSSKWVAGVTLGISLDTYIYILWLSFCHILKTSKGYNPEPVMCKCQPHPHMVHSAYISKDLKTKPVGYCHLSGMENCQYQNTEEDKNGVFRLVHW
jgi:hypothetical protein